jgi:hypothetical protein
MKVTAIVSLVLSVFIAVEITAEPVEDDFWILCNPEGHYCCCNTGGSGFHYATGFLYDSGWSTIWFYNDPIDTTRAKTIHIEFDLNLPWITHPDIDQGGMTVAVGWSTPYWADYGYGDTRPPLPDTWMDEDLCTVREVLLGEPDNLYAEESNSAHFEFDVVVYDYNPEWVSISFQGHNFYIFNGIIIHECVDKTVGVEYESWGIIKSMYLMRN